MMPVLALHRLMKLRGLPRLLHGAVRCRNLSMAVNDSELSVTSDSSTGIATLTMKRPPANSFSASYSRKIVSAVNKIQEDPNTKGLLLTSSVPDIYSAGLNLKDMLNATDDEIADLWTGLQDMWFTLFTCKLPVVSAINGHALAGGCAQALTADYRIMAQGNYRFGLNETTIGLPVPPMLVYSMVNTIGQRSAEYLCQLGIAPDPDGALQYGLVDKVVPPEDLMNEATKEMSKWVKISGPGQQQTKLLMREDKIEKFQLCRTKEVDTVIKTIKSESFQTFLVKYLKSLSKKK